MKLILIIVLVVIIMVIAKGVANQYKERHNFFATIMNFLNSYELNIGFKKDKIKTLVEKLKTNSQSKILFDEYINYLKHDTTLYFENIKVISEEERVFLIDMFSKLGTNDYSNEMAQLKVFKDYIQEKITKSENESNKNYPLIMKLSFLFSLGMALVFI